MRHGWAGLALSLLASATALAAEPAATPTLDHERRTSFVNGEPVILRARIHSPIGKKIFDPVVLVRVGGVQGFTRVPMQPVPGTPDLFSAELPAGLIQGDFDYYLEAFDEEGNGPARAGTPKAPFRVKALASAVVPPPPPEAQPASPDTRLSASSPPERTAGIVTLAVGAGLVVGGLASGGAALSNKGQMQATLDPAVYDSAKRRAENWALAANVACGVGAAAAIVGAIVWITSPSTPSVAVGPTPGGAAVSISGTF